MSAILPTGDKKHIPLNQFKHNNLHENEYTNVIATRPKSTIDKFIIELILEASTVWLPANAGNLTNNNNLYTAKNGEKSQ